MKKSMMIQVLIPLVLIFIAAQAQALPITPGDAFLTGDVDSENNVPKIMEEILAYGITLNDPIYKAAPADNETGLPVGESGSFQMFYDTTFDNEPGDPTEATITHVDGAPFINSVPAYLFVKDGNHFPVWYLFNLSDTGSMPLSWNGIDPLELSGFWPQGGAISHVALYGDTAPVPEPATMLLFGTGLVSLVGARLRRKK